MYMLMHKDLPVLELELHEATGAIIQTGELFESRHVPVGVPVKNGVADRAELNRWWLGRCIPNGRSGIGDALERLGVSAPPLLLPECFGLSLSDQYWIRPEGGKPAWSEINFFENPFPEDVGKALFDMPVSEDGVDLMSPDNTTDGVLRKRWEIIGDTRFLIKGGTAPLFQETLNEVFASQLAERLGAESVPYSLVWTDALPYCVCPDFVSADTELVTARQIGKILPRDRDESKYSHFLRCCDALDIPGMGQFLDRMMTIDFLIANGDRHNGNFGALRNADTLEWIGPAPIYDCGTSLWHDSFFRRGGPEAVVPSKTFAVHHSAQIKLVTSFDWLDMTAAEKAAEDLEQTLSMAPGHIDCGRTAILCDAYRARVNMLSQIIRKTERHNRL